ncbi:MAG: DUF2064 domain-containing protein [Rhodomicrobium sp.]
MRAQPLLVIMAKAPVCGAVKTRLARDIGAVAAASLARTLCAALLREAAPDPRFRTMLAVSPGAALHAPFQSWRLKPRPVRHRAVSKIAKSLNPWSASGAQMGANAHSKVSATTPRPVFLPLGEGTTLQRLRRDSHSQADADILEWQARQGELARERAGVKGCGGDIARIGQGRGGLGARMQRIFDCCGRGPLIIVGTDIPFVTRETIARAFRQLRGADAVFGPAEDGGYWLIGLRRRPQTLSPFQNVRWSSPHALADTLANLRGRRVAFAETLFDIDTLAGYRRFLRRRYR